MYRYNVALWIELNGKEYREDFFIDADDKNDALTEAKNRLPRGAKVKKVIFVEKVG